MLITDVVGYWHIVNLINHTVSLEPLAADVMEGRASPRQARHNPRNSANRMWARRKKLSHCQARCDRGQTATADADCHALLETILALFKEYAYRPSLVKCVHMRSITECHGKASETST